MSGIIDGKEVTNAEWLAHISKKNAATKPKAPPEPPAPAPEPEPEPSLFEEPADDS